MDPTKYQSLKESAAYVGCSTVTLAREIRAGRLKAYKLAGRRVWRLRVADIDTWMAGDTGEEPVLHVASRATSERS
jgi:excisionase family DNA binding protein